MCTQELLGTAITDAIRTGNQDMLDHLSALIKQGGKYSEAFKALIESLHPDAEAIRQVFPG